MIQRRALLLSTLLATAALPALAQEGPQPRLPTEPLTIITRDGKRHDFNVEMALETEQQRVGLMYRQRVRPDEGMLFDWNRPRDAAMWMKNTVTSLDMIFISQDGRISHIAENTVPRSLAIISSNGPARATLEVAAGTAARLGLRVGDKVEQRIFNNAG
ncbi:DUF192 domain-containing protein [Roseomonas elaeocarpi]|uniref:DUF192 domain-containing protein n=1 Tax=Roseomonas elaeocarpi TaxID=907779 RepID=A0ABV6K1S7_9PROT